MGQIFSLVICFLCTFQLNSVPSKETKTQSCEQQLAEHPDDKTNNKNSPSNKVAAAANQKELDLDGIGENAHYGDIWGDAVVYAVGPACDYSWNIKYKNLKESVIL